MDFEALGMKVLFGVGFLRFKIYSKKNAN